MTPPGVGRSANAHVIVSGSWIATQSTCAVVSPAAYAASYTVGAFTISRFGRQGSIFGQAGRVAREQAVEHHLMLRRA